jgi:plasmid stabilization system protein ParE
MSYALIVEPEAEAEIDEASRWYKEISRELGEDFLRAVEEALASIRENPLQYQIIHGRGRRVRLRRFTSYRLFYVVAGQEVVLLGCIHGRRNPKRWQDRIP